MYIFETLIKDVYVYINITRAVIKKHCIDTHDPMFGSTSRLCAGVAVRFAPNNTTLAHNSKKNKMGGTIASSCLLPATAYASSFVVGPPYFNLTTPTENKRSPPKAQIAHRNIQVIRQYLTT